MLTVTSRPGQRPEEMYISEGTQGRFGSVWSQRMASSHAAVSVKHSFPLNVIHLPQLFVLNVPLWANCSTVRNILMVGCLNRCVFKWQEALQVNRASVQFLCHLKEVAWFMSYAEEVPGCVCIPRSTRWRGCHESSSRWPCARLNFKKPRGSWTPGLLHQWSLK